MRKHRDSKLITTERNRNYFVSEPNYHTTKVFAENLLAIEMKIIETLMNKPVYLGLSILELRRISMNQFCYNVYVKSKYDEKAKLCYLDTDSFILYPKTNDIYKDIAEDFETRFHTSNYELDRPLSKGKNRKVIRLMKDELSGKIMTKFVGLRAKIYSYLIDDGSEYEKAKAQKSVSSKENLNLKIVKAV